METGSRHIPVLLKESIEGLALRQGMTVLDATSGGGGHAKVICDIIGKRGLYIGIDADDQAVTHVKHALSCSSCKIFVENANFRQIGEVLHKLKIEEIDAAIFDLGLSSDQLEKSGRGFSFMKEEPLIMTFKDNPAKGEVIARDIVNEWSPENIALILSSYGEEKFNEEIAEAIVSERKKAPIETTRQLVGIIKRAVPSWYREARRNPATKTFQALRMAVNDEITSIKIGLDKAWRVLKPQGRLAIISFHSVEDRAVKRFAENMKRLECARTWLEKPGREEIRLNPRSRSAKLRIVEKIS